MRELSRRTAFVLVALVVGLGRAAAAQTTFSDGEFAAANWDFVQIVRNEGGSVATEVVTDGNPGNALRIAVTIDVAPAYSLIAGVWLWHEAYDPSVSGGRCRIRTAAAEPGPARRTSTTGASPWSHPAPSTPTATTATAVPPTSAARASAATRRSIATTGVPAPRTPA